MGNPMGFLIGALIGGAFGALMALLKMFDGIFGMFGKIKDAVLNKGSQKEVEQEIYDELQAAKASGNKEAEKAALEKWKNKDKIIRERDKKPVQEWASVNYVPPPQQASTEDDKEYEAEMAKVTTIAERDEINKKYKRGKYASPPAGVSKGTPAPVSAGTTQKPVASAGTPTPISAGTTPKPVASEVSGIPGGTPAPVSAGTSEGTSAPAQKTVPSPTSKISDIPSPSGSVADILKQASAATGAPLDIMQKIAYQESKFDPNIKAPSPSTASGLFQFVKDTWKGMLRKYGKKYGLSTDESPFNARANALMGGEYINENIKDIRSSVLSPPPNAADVYAAHFLGSGGAKQLFREIKNDPNTIAAEVFPKQAAMNIDIFYKNRDKSKPRTVKELYEVFAQKMAVDPGPALAKAGTGLTVGEKLHLLDIKLLKKEKIFWYFDGSCFGD